MIETRFGFHILKVEEKRAASTMTFSEAQESVQQMLKENRAGEMIQEVLLKLKENATVEMVAPPGGAPADEGGE